MAQWPSGQRHRTLAELFSQDVSLSSATSATSANSLFDIIQRIFNLWYTNTLTNGKSPPSKFCRHVLNVPEQDCSYVFEWKRMYNHFSIHLDKIFILKSNVLQWWIRWDFKTNLATMWYSSVYKPRCLDKQGTWHKLATISIYSYILCHREVIMSEIWMLSKLNKGIKKNSTTSLSYGLDSALRKLYTMYLWRFDFMIGLFSRQILNGFQDFFLLIF